jgi:hypothetical protein
MQPPVDPAQLSVPAQRILDPKGPAPLRNMAAKGVAPGLRPHEALTVVALLAESGDEGVARIAGQTLSELPGPLLSGALVPDLAPGVLGALAPHYAKRADVMERVHNLPQVLAETVEVVAGLASELVCELIATNEERMIAHPAIIEKLYMNKATRMSTADRIIELAVRHKLELTGIAAYKEAAIAIQGELIAEAQEEDTPDDVLFKETDHEAREIDARLGDGDTHKLDEATGEEKVADELESVNQKIDKMTPAQKIRRAMLGTASERAILVRDNNRLVALAAVKSPLVQENEIVRISSSRNVSDDVLAHIARSRDWTRSYQVKLNLVSNPRTPMMYVTQLVTHLRESDLKKLAQSKNVPGAVQTAARNQLHRKGK